MSTMNDYALYRMYDYTRIELEQEARRSALAAQARGRRRWWRRAQRRHPAEPVAAPAPVRSAPAVIPSQRIEERRSSAPAGR